MNTDKNQTLLFANEDAIFRIVFVAKVVSWIILAIYLVVSIGSITSIVQQHANLPTQFMDWLSLIANLLYPPALGTFYFLVLQGVAQGLNLGLDTFYEISVGDEVEEEEEQN